MRTKFYVTTPIYYVNDIPHIGHAYTTVAADILARYNRLRGRDVFFLTGTDEHGQKVEQAATQRGKTPKEHADIMVENFKGLWKTLNISNDAFIRTTDEPHKTVVGELLSALKDKGEIEKRRYSGWYCTPDERFWTEKDLKDGNCPECGRPVEQIEEENYFFLMSKYHDALVKHIEDNPGYILPETRRNEVLGFLKSQPLGDLCISRPKQRLSWGVPLPFDEDFVTYVWFDALVNYYSATQYLSSGGEWWPASHHLIGKDILTTHAVYWSSMLMALGLPLPKNIFAHGWWTVSGKKMSKSVGNVVAPGAVCGRFGTDAFRYFLMKEVTFGLDGDFSEDALMTRVNTDLANDLGNLASRTCKMVFRYFDGIVPEPAEEETEMKALAEGILVELEDGLSQLRFGKSLEEIWKLVTYANRYIDTNAPWALAKDPSNRERLSTVLYSSLEALRFLAIYLWPFMPAKMEALGRQLGLKTDISRINLSDEALWGRLWPGNRLGEQETLFPRFDKGAPAQVAGEGKKQVQTEETPKTEAENVISIDDFKKVVLKLGRITHAEAVKGSNKLLRLEIDTGEPRQVVAGIGKFYTPEDLTGKSVIIVTNLKPAKLMGVESQGMLLAVSGANGDLSILTVEKDIEPGSRVS